MNQAVQLAAGGDKSKRRELDFYPTPPEVTRALMRFFEERGTKAGIDENSPSLSDGWSILEPACGNGAMSEVLMRYSGDVTSSDIRETGYGIGGDDFLRSDNGRYDAIITNPPFNLSEEFIRKALQKAPIVAMLLKSQYWHAAKRIALFNEFPPAYVLPLTWRPDFLFDQRENGARGAPTMEVHWTVWVSGDVKTKYQLLSRPAL